MSSKFQYSLLRYVHSDLLGESITIGALFYFPQSDYIAFRYPKSLLRIKDLYKGSFSDKLVIENLKGITTASASLSKKIARDKGYQDSIFDPHDDFDKYKNLLLRPDSTSLRFSENKMAVCYANPEKVVDDYYELLFSYYDRDEKVFNRKDEDFLSRTLKGFLREIEPEYQNLIQIKPLIQAPKLPDGIFEFDFAWQNQVVHYVKPLSFDLAESKSINSKAAQYYGYFAAIADEFGSEKIDILTVRPAKSALWSQYDKAIELINSVDIGKNIIELHDYRGYAQQVVDGINHNLE